MHQWFGCAVSPDFKGGNWCEGIADYFSEYLQAEQNAAWIYRRQLLAEFERFNLIAKVDRFGDIAKAMGENVAGLSPRATADKALEAIKQLSSDIGIPKGLKELGVKEKDLRTMAENAQKDACGLTNPRCPTLEDVIQIYTWAL